MSASFSPSPAELALVSQIFIKADPQKLGIITGDVAVRVFGGAKLTPTVLGEIWSLADEENKGWLPKRGVAIAVRLMGWAQKGEKVTQALIDKPGPLPVIEGVSAPITQHNTGVSLPKSPPPGLPLLTPQDKTKFQRLFASCGPINGLLSGEKARDVFVKSKLPVEKLGQIWNLADTQDRGALDSTDFAIGMYLIQASMSGQLSFIPSSLPPGLYEQAGGKAALSGVTAHATGGSGGSFSPAHSTFTPSRNAAIQPQYTGQTLQPQTTGVPFKSPTTGGGGPPLPSRPSARVPPSLNAPQANGQTQTWDVTAAEKASADRFFDTLDSQKNGYIEGDVAVPFMLQSNLSEDVLAQVWDLSDINNDGRITRDGFAVAMHLIQGKLAGKDIPTSLPASLVPPSMRSNGAVHAPAQESLRDLLWDDTSPVSTTSTQPPSQPSTLYQEATVFEQHPSPFAALPSSPPQTATNQDPFGGSFGSSRSRDLLGDDDEPATSSPPLHDQSAEIGNVQNQLNSTNRSLETTKTERANIEQTLANQAAQLSALQTQLASAKAAYETETKLLATLRDRHSTQTADIQKAREELIRSESDLSAIRVEKTEIEGSFLRDKEEVRDLQRKMTEAGTSTEMLKVQVEKAKKEAKQQKGLLAIARKQLSTKEAERAKVEKELLAANAEVKESTKEIEQAEAELAKEAPTAAVESPERTKSPGSDSVAFAAAHALPVTPDPTSPTGSVLGKSNNPFDRLAASSGTSSPRSQSPFLPFADTSSMPTPPTASKVPTQVAPVVPEDPFGFSQAFPAQPASAPIEDTGISTPRQGPPGLAFIATNGEFAASPTSDPSRESDFFSTPPTATDDLPRDPAAQSPASSGADHFPSLGGASTQFQAINGQLASEEHPSHDTETDLDGQLKELDIDESESDSDDESLADRRASLEKANDSAAAIDKDSTPTANGTAPANLSTFDDAFGQTTTPKPASPLPSGNTSPRGTQTPDITAKTAPADAFGAPLAKVPSPFDPQTNDAPLASNPEGPALTVAGVNDFDEAMGKIPSAGPTPAAPQFSFDSAFDDNFDFASASTFSPPPAVPPSTFPPAPSASLNGKSNISMSPGNQTDGFDGVFAVPTNYEHPAPPASSQPEEQKSLAFDDVFTSGSAATQSQVSSTASPPTKSNHGISFDEAFGGFDPSSALKLGNTFNSTSPKVSATPPRADSMSAFPTSTPPVSPRGPSSPHISSMRSSSPPPREMSPPPRLSSPRPRPSTSSSHKEPTPERPKEPPRQSKLSIRLPFGKKKSKQRTEAPPPPTVHPSQFLSPVEEPTGTITPAVEDDVDAVKQLCGMGFSRTQAVVALEKHGYDVQKALNSLLGSQ